MPEGVGGQMVARPFIRSAEEFHHLLACQHHEQQR